MKRFVSVALSVAVFATIGCSSVRAQQTAPPANYKKVSTLVALPDFVPGLGTLYVDPATLPAGPFLAYDKQGKLVSSVYMIPLKDITAHKAFNNLAAANQEVDPAFAVSALAIIGSALPCGLPDPAMRTRFENP